MKPPRRLSAFCGTILPPLAASIGPSGNRAPERPGRHARRRTSWPGVDRRIRAFSLVEMLVAMSIFVLLTLLLTQLVTSTSALAVHDNNKMDMVSDTRQALNRFGLDWEARVRRTDVDWVVAYPDSLSTINDASAAGSPDLVILSEVTGQIGTGTGRGVASVSYRINPSTYALERGTQGYSWSNPSGFGTSSPPLLTFTTTGSTVLPIVPATPASANYEPLAATVFRVCFSYLDTSNGTPKWTVVPPANTTMNPSGNWISLNATNLGALAVTVASLDITDRTIIVSPTQYKQLATALGQVATAQSATQDPKELWTQQINSSSFAQNAGVPTRVASAVHVYQKIFYLTN